MPGRKLRIDWHEDAATLLRLYRAEREVELRTRFHALWLLCQGHTIEQTAQILGVHVRTLQHWLAWYRAGGIAAVRQHRHGGRQGRVSFLTQDQRQHLQEQIRQGAFSTPREAMTWVQDHFGVTYTEWGMRSLLRRLNHNIKETPKRARRPRD